MSQATLPTVDRVGSVQKSLNINQVLRYIWPGYVYLNLYLDYVWLKPGQRCWAAGYKQAWLCVKAYKWPFSDSKFNCEFHVKALRHCLPLSTFEAPAQKSKFIPLFRTSSVFKLGNSCLLNNRALFSLFLKNIPVLISSRVLK